MSISIYISSYIIWFSYKHDSGTKIRHADRWNKTEEPVLSAYNYSHLIINKGKKNTHWSKGSVSHKWCWGNWTTTYRRMRLDHYLWPCTKITCVDSKTSVWNLKLWTGYMKTKEVPYRIEVQEGAFWTGFHFSGIKANKRDLCRAKEQSREGRARRESLPSIYPIKD